MIPILRVVYKLPYVDNSNNFSVLFYHSSTLYLAQDSANIFLKRLHGRNALQASMHTDLIFQTWKSLNLHSNFQDNDKVHQTYTTKMLYYSNNFDKMAIKDGT